MSERKGTTEATRDRERVYHKLMRAAWWWIDRWRKSTAFTDMTLAEQGAYRNLLDELWLRDGVIPNDQRILAQVCGGPFEWEAVREKVLAKFKLTADGWRNDTHDSIRKESKRLAEKQARYRDRVSSNVTGNMAGDVGRSPSPSPSQTYKQSINPSLQSKEQLFKQETRLGAINPLLEGKRPALEVELLKLVRREAELTERDGMEVMAEVTGFEGSKRTKLNPATMTDDRLMNSVLDARARVKQLEEKHGRTKDGATEGHREDGVPSTWRPTR